VTKEINCLTVVIIMAMSNYILTYNVTIYTDR